MSDQCKHCTVRGNYEKCLATICNGHESWIDIERIRRIAEMQGFIQDIADGGGFIGAAAKEFIKDMKPLDPAFSKTVDKHFWDLVDDTKNPFGMEGK